MKSLRDCENCDQSYTPKRKDQRWCSPECRSQGHRSDSRRYYHENSERVKSVVRDYRTRNAQTIIAKNRARYTRDRDALLEQKKQYYLDNLDRIKQYRRRNADHNSEVARQYVERNREKIREQQRQYRLRNIEHTREVQRAWRKANPNLCRLIDQRKRASRESEACEITLRDWNRVLHRYRQSCAYCGKRGPLHVDHVFPLSRGGRHSIGNVLPACPFCNLSKSNKFLIEWRTRSTCQSTLAC